MALSAGTSGSPAVAAGPPGSWRRAAIWTGWRGYRASSDWSFRTAGVSWPSTALLPPMRKGWATGVMPTDFASLFASPKRIWFSQATLTEPTPQWWTAWRFTSWRASLVRRDRTRVPTMPYWTQRGRRASSSDDRLRMIAGARLPARRPCAILRRRTSPGPSASGRIAPGQLGTRLPWARKHDRVAVRHLGEGNGRCGALYKRVLPPSAAPLTSPLSVRRGSAVPLRRSYACASAAASATIPAGEA